MPTTLLHHFIRIGTILNLKKPEKGKGIYSYTNCILYMRFK
jgi:hypothetical protein